MGDLVSLLFVRGTGQDCQFVTDNCRHADIHTVETAKKPAAQCQTDSIHVAEDSVAGADNHPSRSLKIF